jgi:hypothetical protein
VGAGLTTVGAGCEVASSVREFDGRGELGVLIRFDGDVATVTPTTGTMNWIARRSGCIQAIDTVRPLDRACSVFALYRGERYRLRPTEPIRLVEGGPRQLPLPTDLSVLDESLIRWMEPHPPARLLTLGASSSSDCPVRPVHDCFVGSEIRTLVRRGETAVLAVGAAPTEISHDTCAAGPAEVANFAVAGGDEVATWLIDEHRLCQLNAGSRSCTLRRLSQVLRPIDLWGSGPIQRVLAALPGAEESQVFALRIEGDVAYVERVSGTVGLLGGLRLSGYDVVASHQAGSASKVVTNPGGPRVEHLVDGARLGTGPLRVAGLAAIEGSRFSVILSIAADAAIPSASWYAAWPVALGEVRRIAGRYDHLLLATDRGLGHHTLLDGFRLCPGTIVDATRVVETSGGAWVVAGRAADGTWMLEWYE